MLRCIAGFEELHQGEIDLGGQLVSRRGLSVPPEQRRIGMVFQDNALFPHLTVGGNVAFGLRGQTALERKQLVDEMLEVVGLHGYGDRYPHELSGGQQQRVALARALAPRPELILLDEPFSSLDVDLRERLALEVRDILKERGMTTVLVTHDQHEAFALAEHIGVMQDGRILQWDTAYNLYHEPADRFIAHFIGQGVFLRGRLVAPDAVEIELGTIRGNRAYQWPTGSEVDVLLRPDDIQPDSDSDVSARIMNKAFKGAEIMYVLRLPTGSTVMSLFPSHMNYAIGDEVGIKITADHLVAFPA